MSREEVRLELVKAILQRDAKVAEVYTSSADIPAADTARQRREDRIRREVDFLTDLVMDRGLKPQAVKAAG